MPATVLNTRDTPPLKTRVSVVPETLRFTQDFATRETAPTRCGLQGRGVIY